MHGSKYTEDNTRVDSCFSTIYNELADSVFRFIYFMVGERDEADDITQEVFFRLYDYIQSGVHIKDPKAWTFRVGVNIAINMIKRKNKFRELLQLAPDQLMDRFSSESGQDVEKAAIKDQQLFLVREAMNSLPGRDRVIIALYQDGFSYAQMAKMVGVKKASMRTILYRAINKLEKNINQGDKHEMHQG